MKVFISYRTGATDDFVGRLEDRLRAALGTASVIRASSAVIAGGDFRLQLGALLSGSDVVLAVIGPEWAVVERREQPVDYVRTELVTALQLGKPVIPVLVGDTPVPNTTALPQPLAQLGGLHAVRLDSSWDGNFDSDFAELVQHLEHYRPRSRRSRTWLAVGALLGVFAAALLVWMALSPKVTISSTTAEASSAPSSTPSGAPTAVDKPEKSGTPTAATKIASPEIEASDSASVSVQVGNVNVVGDSDPKAAGRDDVAPGK